MSITLVNVCSNSVECWGGIQTSRRRVNTIIIMLYTALSVGKHTPLQSWMREPVSHVIPANTKRSANVGIMLAPLNQQLSWHALSVPPPSPNVDQLSGLGRKLLWHTVYVGQRLFCRQRCWLDRETTFSQHFLFTCIMCMHGSCGLMTTNNYWSVYILIYNVIVICILQWIFI